MAAVKRVRKPRKAVSAYMFFVKACRQEHRRRFPDEYVWFSEYTRFCALRWKAMELAQKQRFFQQAEEDKLRFEKETQEFEGKLAQDAAIANAKVILDGMAKKELEPTEKVEMKKPIKKKTCGVNKKAKDPDAPKPVVTPFVWFSKDQKKLVIEANPEFRLSQVRKELCRLWANADADTRTKYRAMADKDRLRFKDEEAEYQRGKKAEAEAIKNRQNVNVKVYSKKK